MSAGFAKMDTEYTNSTSTSEGLTLRFSPDTLQLYGQHINTSV